VRDPARVLAKAVAGDELAHRRDVPLGVVGGVSRIQAERVLVTPITAQPLIAALALRRRRSLIEAHQIAEVIGALTAEPERRGEA
jgi:hypothetical protein